ncbi:MAG: NAD-dependent epimerase/dehydratase family protein [Casimicrobiaceae bacterium]
MHRCRSDPGACMTVAGRIAAGDGGGLLGTCDGACLRVVVTGAAGRLACAVLPRLCADPRVERVTGIDRAPMAFRHPKFDAVVADIAGAETRAQLAGASALVNLAFVLLRGRRPLRAFHASNVTATQALLAAAGDAGVGAIIHLSSAAVYGCGETLTEEAPYAPLPGFHYAAHKVAVDRWIAHQLPHAAVLRPVMILGPNALPVLRQAMAAPCYVRLPDPQPRLQCVHEDDVAQAVLLALGTRPDDPHVRPDGVFNLAAPGTFSLRELVRARRPHAFGVSPALARAFLDIAWLATGWGGERGWHRGIGCSLTLDCARAERVLGWRPRHAGWRDVIGLRRDGDEAR